ncbi:MAG: hypothetical protein D6812_10990 [Deltaproteobacteria bacterium]|nr:MAG: hypothetical protein D6812_10990 [Deltaproteobacteria bacterium]
MLSLPISISRNDASFFCRCCVHGMQRRCGMGENVMNRSILLRLATLVFTLCALLLFGGVSRGTERQFDTLHEPVHSEYVPGEVLVNFGSLTREAIRSIKTSLALRTLEQIPTLKVERLVIESERSVNDVVLALLDRGVAFAEPNYIRHPTLVPNDPDFDRLYGLEKIGIEAAWEVVTGGEIVVAVIDSGGDFTHPDLGGNNWINAAEDINDNGIFDNEDLNGIDDDGNGYIDDVVGYNFAEDTPIPYTSAGDDFHGTHVSGTIGAVGNNGIGITGVLWDVRIMRVKFISGAGGSDFDAAQAIVYAVDNGARVSNNSWGGSGASTTLANAVKYARDNGMVFVAAAGNSRTNNDRLSFYPAAYPYSNVVAVAATDANDRLAPFSNYGVRTVDVAAPGVGIYSTFPDGEYGELDGTSMASPHVAGVAALLLLADPDLTPKEVRDILVNTSDPISALGTKVQAAGRINAARALECVTTGENCERQAPLPDPGRCGIVPGASNPAGLFFLLLTLLLFLPFRLLPLRLPVRR